MIKKSVFTILLFSVFYANAQYFIEFERFGFKGLRNTFGNELVPIGKYDYFLTERSIDSNYVIAVKNNKSFLLNKKGNVLSKEGYISIYYLGKGLFSVKKMGWYYLMDSTGKVLNSKGYDVINRVVDTLLSVRKNKKCGYINSKGKVIIPLRFENVGRFINGLTVAKKEDSFGLINIKGEFAIPPTYNLVRRFAENINIVQTRDSTWGIMDDRQNWIMKPIICDGLIQMSPQHNIYLLYKGSLKKLLRITGEIIVDSLPCDGDRIEFYDSLFLFTNKSKLRFYNQNGILLQEFDRAIVLYKGRIFKGEYANKNNFYELKLDGSFHQLPIYKIFELEKPSDSLIFSNSAQNKIVILNKWSGKIQEYNFEQIEQVSILGKNFYIIKKNKLSGLTDTDFNILIQPLYREIKYLSNEKFLSLNTDSVSYLFNIESKELTSFKNIKIVSLVRNGFIFNYSGQFKYGLMNYKQQVIIPPVYDNLYNRNDEGYVEATLIMDSIKATNKDTELKPIITNTKKSIKSKVGLISLKNKIISPVKWNYFRWFSNGVIVLNSNGKFGVIDSVGKLVLPVIYDEIRIRNNKTIEVMQNHQYGLFSVKGVKLVPILYEKTPEVINEYFYKVYKNGKYGLINKKQELLIDFLYDNIYLEAFNGLLYYVCILPEWEHFDYYDMQFHKQKLNVQSPFQYLKNK